MMKELEVLECPAILHFIVKDKVETSFYFSGRFN